MYERDILENLREQINNVDNEILILIKRRLKIVKKVFDYKKSNNMEIFQPNREQEVINKLVSTSITMGIDVNFTTNMFHLIIEESKQEQERLKSKIKNEY